MHVKMSFNYVELNNASREVSANATEGMSKTQILKLNENVAQVKLDQLIKHDTDNTSKTSCYVINVLTKGNKICASSVKH